MIILPAIDIRNGKCVRLYQGKFDTSEIVAQDPVETARSFEEKGAQYIHMVDLDGALEGYAVNESIIFEVVKNINVPVELGGGIRDMKTVEKLIKGGISRVILGSAALQAPSLVREAIKEFKEKIAVGIDAKNGYVSIEGWLNTSDVYYIDFAKKMEDIGVDNIIFTDISRDGTLKGPNLEQLSVLKENISCKITASGGIKDIEDIKLLKKMDIYGAITGKAIYSGGLSLEEAIREVNT
jgi:phosphoribosylformimino-5-aminoimidazole carboxamide ribotide isomerase